MAMRLLPRAGHMSEFISGLHGDCVETAMAAAIAIAEGGELTAALLSQIVASMQGQGIASANGATTINKAYLWLTEAPRHYATLAYVPYGEPFQGDWRALVQQYKTSAPIILNIANAGALPGDEHGVQYHGLCTVGDDDTDPNIVYCCDGDNRAIATAFARYTLDDLAAAKPCGMIVLKPQGGSPVSTLPAPYAAAGWSDNGTTLQAQNVPVVRGFRQHILDAMQTLSWRADDYPLAQEYSTPDAGMLGAVESHGPGSEQLFRHTMLSYTVKDNVFEVWTGASQTTWRDQYAALVATNATLQKQLVAQQTPPPATLPEYAVESMAVVDHLAAALAVKPKGNIS